MVRNDSPPMLCKETVKQSIITPPPQHYQPVPSLTHWGWVKHIFVSKLTIIGSDNGLSPGRRQAIIWTNVGILLIGTLGTNFSEILSEIHTFSFKKMRLKMSSAKWRPFCLSLNVLPAIALINPCFHGLILAASDPLAFSKGIFITCTKHAMCPQPQCYKPYQPLTVICSKVQYGLLLFLLEVIMLTHWGQDKMAAIFQTSFSNRFFWMKMYQFWLIFHWSLFPRVQLTIFQHWLR